MKNVVIFGASGRTGKYISRKLLQLPDIRVTLFVRNPDRLSEEEKKSTTVITGDALKLSAVKTAMEGQDILLCSLEGDVLTMAENIVQALTDTSVRRIIWITGMGIHNEITGLRGRMLQMYARQRPDYIKAADLIAGSTAVTTLLRCPLILDGEHEAYSLTEEGVQPADRPVDRAAIAKCMADMVADEALGADQSLGITN